MTWREYDWGFDWHDGGEVEVELKDGQVLTVSLAVEEYWDGVDEYPVPIFYDDDGNYLNDIVRWRPVPKETGR